MKLGAPKGEGALALEDLDGATEGLVALAGRAALVGGRYGVGGLVDRLVGIFGRANVCVEVQRHLRRDEASDNQALLDLASAFRVPVVATGGVRFAAPDARPLYDVVTCIRHKTTLSGAGRRLSVNAERYLKPADQMARLFADLPHAVAETRELADRLEFTLADLGYRVVALDFERELVARLQERYSDWLRTGRLEVMEGDMYRLPWQIRQFDLAYHQGVLEHVSDENIVRALREQGRVARRIIFDVPNHRYGAQPFGDERLLAIRHWKRLIQEAGLTLETVLGRDFHRRLYLLPYALFSHRALERFPWFSRNFAVSSIFICRPAGESGEIRKDRS